MLISNHRKMSKAHILGLCEQIECVTNAHLFVKCDFL
jgi:hypothetical protein